MWLLHAKASSRLSCHTKHIVLQTFSLSPSLCKRKMEERSARAFELESAHSSIKVTKIQRNVTCPPRRVSDCVPPLSLSLSLSASLSLSLSVSVCFFPSPSFSLQQREKRWSISSAGGEKNSSSVSRKGLTRRDGKAGGSDVRGEEIALAFS